MKVEIEEKKSMILSFMKDKEYRPMKLKEIMMVLNIPHEDRLLLEEVLSQLVDDGKIIITKKGKYAVPEQLHMITGTFEGNEKGFGFLIQDEPEKRDVFIPAEFTNGAMHKDKILCRMMKEETTGRRAEAEVVKILQRGSKEIIGTFEESQNFGFVIPDEKKYAQDIFVPKALKNGAVSGHKVVVQITTWPQGKRNPEGRVKEILGHINDPGTDIMAIIRQFGLPTEFPEEVMRQIQSIPEEVKEDDKGNREDLRDLTMVTIDGEDAKDLDDAVSLEKLENGKYRLGVHIADVTHYVREHTPLDEEAFTRGTSVYLVDRVIPMIPHKLSNGICSLNANTDRLALSCIMDIDKEGKVVNHKIMESLINVDRRMTYTNVKKILVDQDEELREEYKSFIDLFENMESLAAILRKRRTNRGAIDFDFEEAKIYLDEKGKPVDIRSYERNVATRIIEEFMLVCNETIAETHFWQDIPFVYRSHEDPDPEKVKKLEVFIRNLGYQFKGSSKIHPKDFQKVLGDIADTPEEPIISRLMLRSMQQARYTATSDGHFGLAAKFYCHFTSPIRRYPDLQIHRIIKENLRGKLSPKRQGTLNKQMPEISKHCSLTERRAEEAERETEKLKKVEYMEQHIGEEFEGVISGITSWGMYVELPNTVEGLIHVVAMDDDYYIYDEEHMLFIGERTKKIFRLGDQVKVLVAKADRIRRQIDFELVSE